MDQFLAGVEQHAFRMAQLATRNRDEALDLVQDAMFKLVQRYANRGESEWGPLFYRILQSRIQDWHRRTWIRNRWRVWTNPKPATENDQDGDWLESFPDLCTPDPSDHLADRQAAVALETALHDLPLRQRQAFLLRAWEGYDVAQTAQAMGCSSGSVKTHYSRAIHSLRVRLNEHEP